MSENCESELAFGIFDYQFLEKAAFRHRQIKRRYMSIYQQLAKWDEGVEQLPPLRLELAGGHVRFVREEGGEEAIFSRSEKGKPSVAERLLASLGPWRKGPYHLPGFTIESEWDSSYKWHRLEPLIGGRIAGLRVVDVGAHNGYFMLQMALSGAEWIIGLEPMARAVAQYDSLRSLLRTGESAVHLRRQKMFPLGYEDLGCLRGEVDVVLLLGILYHHSDPLKILQLVHRTLRGTGCVLLDCAGIPGPGAWVLFPDRRYTGKRGFYYLPTERVLMSWLRRVGFRNIQVIYSGALSAAEQEERSWAAGASLREGLLVSNEKEEKKAWGAKTGAKTIEGYPAPWRYYVRATK